MQGLLELGQWTASESVTGSLSRSVKFAVKKLSMSTIWAGLLQEKQHVILLITNACWRCDFDYQNQQNWYPSRLPQCLGNTWGDIELAFLLPLRQVRLPSYEPGRSGHSTCLLWATTPDSGWAWNHAFTLVMKYGEMYLVGEMRDTDTWHSYKCQ